VPTSPAVSTCRPRTIALTAAVALVALVVSGAGTPAADAVVPHPATLATRLPSTGTDSQIKQADDDLAAANRAVTRAAAALAAAKAAMPAAQAARAKADAAFAAAGSQAAVAAAAEARASVAVRQAQRTIAAAQQRITTTGNQVAALVRAVYIQGPYVELAAVLSATSPADFAERIAAVSSVSRSQSRALAEAQAAKADLALANLQALAAQKRASDARAAATAALETAARARASAITAQNRVAALLAQRTQALAVANRERAKVKRQYAALLAQQRNVSRIDKRRNGGYRGKPSGSLLWPIPGAGISGGVGWRVHPVYGYRSCHTGTDIRGGYGTPILAAADGRVTAVISGGAYGLHTLINHGGGISTMYAHQSRTFVHAGEIVHRGEVIGYVGASGWVTGPHLHFEVHVNGVPYDPMGWFGGTRQVVPCWHG
jgi:murein DD-endopeptidase MepM/ murein hydrolase activator NlpD